MTTRPSIFFKLILCSTLILRLISICARCEHHSTSTQKKSLLCGILSSILSTSSSVSTQERSVRVQSLLLTRLLTLARPGDEFAVIWIASEALTSLAAVSAERQALSLSDCYRFSLGRRPGVCCSASQSKMVSAGQILSWR